MDDTDTLWAGPFTAADTGITAYMNNGTTNTNYNYIIYEPDGDYSENQIELDNIFIGNWITAYGDYVFGKDGICTVTGLSGQSSEYSYLVRKDRLVTLSHGSNPVLQEYSFIKTNTTIKAVPMTGGEDLIFTPAGT
jgi:hypothetical protein